MILTRSLKFIPTYRYQPELQPAYLAQIQSGLIKERSMQHLDKFIRDCKEAGVWSKLSVCIPFIGESIGTALIDIMGNVSISGVNFVAGDYSEATGLTGNGTTKYLNLNYSATNLGATGHLSFYQRNDDAQAGNRYHGAGSLTDHYIIGGGNPATNSSFRYGLTTFASHVSPQIKGFYFGQRASATSLKLYRNNVETASNATNTVHTPPALNLYAWCWNDNGAPANYTNANLCFFSIGQDLTDPQRTAFYSIVQTLQVNLGRGV